MRRLVIALAGIRRRPRISVPPNGGGRGFFLVPRPAHARRGLLCRIDSADRRRPLLLTLASWGGRKLPADHESFAALCGRLRSPIVAEALAISKPISPIFHRKGMQNVWKHFEKWRGPSGFHRDGRRGLRVNPVYAQGMTSASVCSQVLGTLIAETDPTDANFPVEFFKRQAEFVRQPWSLSVARDRQALGQSNSVDGAMAGEGLGTRAARRRRHPRNCRGAVSTSSISPVLRNL